MESLITKQGSRLDLTDERVDGSAVELDFGGVLRGDQAAALDAITGRDLGVLVAAPGVGKTVIACAAIARTGRPTLVLVDRKTLADQWRAQIGDLLGVKAGQLGGGRTKRGGVIDVAMLQTLARRDNVAEITSAYGLVVVDECHHVPAAAFEDVVRQIPARRWLGLTATPYRRDRLDDLIGLQLGPVRHTIAADTTPVGQLPVAVVEPGPERRLVLHHTTYQYSGDTDPFAPGGIAAVYRDLVADDDRLTLVVDDVIEAVARRRHCLVLTQWTAHVDRFPAELTARGHEPVVLVGGMGARARAAAMARLDPEAGDRPLLVVATGPYVGEGFDCPALDTLFLAAPISFSGRLVQYAGRILRHWPGKETAEVHDYVDADVPILASSLTKRARGYTSLGFPDPRGLPPQR